MWEDDRLKGAADTCVDEGTTVLPDDELAEEMTIDRVDTVADEGLVVEATELIWEVDELRDAVNTCVDVGTTLLPDDELVEEMAIDCVDKVADERLFVETIVDELKDSVDICVDKGTAVLPEDELAEMITIDCVDTMADEGLLKEVTELMGEVGTDLVEVTDGLVAQDESLR